MNIQVFVIIIIIIIIIMRAIRDCLREVFQSLYGYAFLGIHQFIQGSMTMTLFQDHRTVGNVNRLFFFPRTFCDVV